MVETYVLMDVVAIALAIGFLAGFLRAYSRLRIRSLLVLATSAVIVLIAYVSELCGRVCRDLRLARILFKVYLASAPLVLCLLLACSMMMRYERPPARYFVSLAIIGAALAFRIAVVRVDVFRVGALIARTPPMPCRLDFSFMAVSSGIVCAEWTHLWVAQVRIVRGRARLLLLSCGLGLILTLVSVPLCDALVVLGLLRPSVAPLLSLSVLPCGLATFALPYALKPELACVIPAQSEGVIVLSRRGLCILALARDKTLVKKVVAMLRAVLALGHVILPDVGELRSLSLDGLSLLIGYADRFIACVMTRRVTRMHEFLLGKITSVLSRVRHEDPRALRSVLAPYLAVLMPELAE